MKTAKDTDNVASQPEDEELFLVFFEQVTACPLPSRQQLILFG